MTASTTQASTITTQTTVYLPNVLLDESNYPTWLFRLESFLKGQNLYGYVDGSTPCPTQFVSASDGSGNIVSSEYTNWKIQDQSIVNMIGQTLSPVAMSCAVGSKSAQDMWNRLKLKFAAPNRQNILQLKSNLQNLKKGGDDIETYMDKIKAARDALETVGVFVDDEDIVVTVLRGLPSEYAAIKTVIRAQFVACSVGELKTLLKAAEIDIESEIHTSSTTSLTAMMAKNTDANPASGNIQGASTLNSQSQVPTMPPGFGPLLATPANNNILLSSQAPYVPIPALPYGGIPQVNSFSMTGPSQSMTGFYAGRPNGQFGNNNTRFNTNSSGYRGNSNFNNGMPRGNAGLHNTFFRPNAGGTGFTCQLCGKPGHGAKTCRSLPNFQNPQLGNSNITGCQYCGKPNHTADRCYYIFGFPGQQQSVPQLQTVQTMQTQPSQQFQNAQQGSQHQGVAMFASTSNSNTPQYWLADSGATNHMTSEVQLLNNLVPYNATDSVQIGDGQGAGKGAVQGTE